MRIRSLSVFANLYEEEPAEAGHEVTGLSLCNGAESNDDEAEPPAEAPKADSFLPAA